MIEIEVDKMDLRQLEWEWYSDTWGLIPTASSLTGKPRVCEQDVRRYFYGVVRQIARKVPLTYEEVEKIMVEENAQLMSYINAIFKENAYYKLDDERIINIRKLFVVPCVDVSVHSVYQQYRLLSDKDQKTFHEMIGD